MEEGSIVPIDQLYLLRNNSFLKQEASLTNTEYKILNLTMVNVQKQLKEKYPDWDKETIKQMPPAIECTLYMNQLRQMSIRENDLYGENLGKILKKLNTTQINFVSYITGGYVFSHLISEFEVNKTTGNIRAMMSKQVFMFLLDYKGDFDYRKNFPDDEDVRKSVAPKRKLLVKGYTKIDISAIDKFKSYYTQVMYSHFKAELEKRVALDENLKSFDIGYDIITLRKICGTLMVDDKGNESLKFPRYRDFKKKVIDRAIEELETGKYFNISFIENKGDVRGGKKVKHITFTVTPGEALEYSNIHEYKKKKEAKKEAKKEKTSIDVEYEEVKDNPALSIVLSLKDKARINLAVSTIQDFVEVFGIKYVKTAAMYTINRANDKEKKRLTAPKQYMLAVLKDLMVREEAVTKLENEKRASEENNRKSSEINITGFNNFEAREYDYDSLERRLLGWDKD